MILGTAELGARLSLALYRIIFGVLWLDMALNRLSLPQ